MLAGAFAAVLVGVRTGSPWLGALAAAGAGALVGLLFAYWVLRLRADAIVVGAAVDILALGATVGVWRMMEVLDRLGIRASVNLNADVCRHYPQIVKAGVERGWEFLGHGLTNSQLLAGLSEEEERTVIQQTYDVIREAAGTAPAGWLGPALTETHVTPDLLAEVGFRYVADWCDDDQPHPMRTRSGTPLISVPYSIEINDYTAILGFCSRGSGSGR